MKSYLVRKKSLREILKFFEDNPRIYPINLEEFLKCSPGHAKRVFYKIKITKNIKTNYIEPEDLYDYFDLN